MKKELCYLLFMCCVGNTLDAQDLKKETSGRLHSVRKVIDSVGKLEKKDVSIVDSVRNMFKDAKVLGQLRVMSAGYEQNELGVSNNYATAVGGIVKYELAAFNGFNAAAAVYTSNDLGYLSGSNEKHNPELSSTDRTYTEIAEAYINYKYNDLNLRLGRQVLNTPLADSDDIRMIQNTFEAYIATYSLHGFEMMLGNIQSWQGVDTGLDDHWRSVSDGDSKNGTTLVGVTYNDGLELNAWYYNISGFAHAFYLDGGFEYSVNENMLVHLGQYLKENELKESQIAGDIYGGLIEFVAYDIGFNGAFNYSSKVESKQSFSGTGGGTMFTSMDSMIIDNIANDRDVVAYVFGVSYGIGYFGFLYAHGDFLGSENSSGTKEHIVEHDMGFEYSFNDEFLVSAIYTLSEDKENTFKTQYDFNRAQLMMNYNF